MRTRDRDFAVPGRLLVAVASAAVAMAMTGCAAPAAPASSGSGLLQVHDPGHVTYSVHPADCHAGPGPTPDHRCTPGAIDPAVTQDNLQSMICRPGYTRTVRPPVSETNRAKRSQYQSYSIPAGTTSELDHLVPLELAGSNDIANLWPEVGPESGNPKDRVENDLHAAVCSGKVRLADAQQAIAQDWTTAEHQLGVG